MQDMVSSISPKGQITIPIQIRRLLGATPKDKVAFRVEAGEVKITLVRSRLAAGYMSVPPLPRPMTLSEMTGLAREEQAAEAAREGV